MKTKIKLITLIIVIIAMMFILSGCTISKSIITIEKTVKEDRFIEIYNEVVAGYTINLFYDKETKVIYATKNDYRNSITALLDAEGKPLLYEGE